MGAEWTSYFGPMIVLPTCTADSLRSLAVAPEERHVGTKGRRCGRDRDGADWTSYFGPAIGVPSRTADSLRSLAVAPG